MKKVKSSPITSEVIRQIERGDITMKPRRYFVILSLLSVVGIVVSAIVISYLFSIMFFWLRIQSADTMAWGARANLDSALDSFPLWAIPVIIGVFALMVWLIRRQGNLYKYRTSMVLAVVVTLGLVTGLALSYTGIGSMHGPNSRDTNRQIQRGHNYQLRIDR